MQKIVLISAVAASLLSAQQVSQNSIATMLEAKKVKKTETSSFMPNISLIVDASYTNSSFDNADEAEHVEIPGFVHGGGHSHEGHSHGTLAGEDGFNLNYAELTIGASVDKYFDLMGIFHLSENEFEIEEAFATTRSLPYSLQLKLGKFKSDFGYLNNKHHHNYNFSDAPLVYTAFLGDHGLTEKGFQLQYVVPAPYYVMVGVEALKGENERSFGSEGFTVGESGHDHEEEHGHDDHDDHDEHHEESISVEDATFPGIVVGYVKTSFDLGAGTLLAGVSVAQGDFRMNHTEDENPHTYHGENTLYGVDMTYKHYFSADHAITWQSEYMMRDMDGTKYVENAEGEWTGIGFKKEQSGFYSELVYQHDANWRAGLRYSAISQNDITANGNAKDIADDMYITTAMLEYNPTEFSRIRLQYDHNSALYTDEGEKNNKHAVTLQFNYAIGAHGAHAF